MDNQRIPSVGNKEKTENVLIAMGIIAVALVMAVVSWFILPDYVSTQLAGFSTGVPALPKWLAVLFPFLITTILAASSVNCRRQFPVSLIGFALNVVFWLIN